MEELRERTGGHPLYVRTLLAELPPEAVASGKMGEELPVPPSLRQGIQAQLEHLPSSSRRLLEALAVLDAGVS